MSPALSATWITRRICSVMLNYNAEIHIKLSSHSIFGDRTSVHVYTGHSHYSGSLYHMISLGTWNWRPLNCSPSDNTQGQVAVRLWSHFCQQIDIKIWLMCFLLKTSYLIYFVINQITSKDPLFSTGISIQYSVMGYMGKEAKKEWIYVHA